MNKRLLWIAAAMLPLVPLANASTDVFRDGFDVGTFVDGRVPEVGAPGAAWSSTGVVAMASGILTGTGDMSATCPLPPIADGDDIRLRCRVRADGINTFVGFASGPFAPSTATLWFAMERPQDGETEIPLSVYGGAGVLCSIPVSDTWHALEAVIRMPNADDLAISGGTAVRSLDVYVDDQLAQICYLDTLPNLSHVGFLNTDSGRVQLDYVAVAIPEPSVLCPVLGVMALVGARRLRPR